MKKLLMVLVLVASAVAASAQSLLPRRTLGSRLARPTQTVSQTADATKDREARKARAAQRSQFSAGSSTTEFDRECETLFMDIVREAEICQTNLAMYATYPYWPDAMRVVSNFCEKGNCVVVDVGHNFGSWKQGSWWQGSGKNAYVVRSNLEAERWFVPQRWRKDGFCVISRGGSYTNVVYSGVGSVCCYDSDGRFVEMYDSLDKIPAMKQCFDDELKLNYGEQDRWMKAHGFAEEGSGREAENRLDAARTNAIDRLKSLRTILSSFPQWRSDNQWYGVCDVGAGMGGPSMYGESIGVRPLLGGLRRPGSKPSVNINTNDAVLVGVNERFECLGRKQDKLIETVVRDLTGLEFGAPADTNGVLDLKFNLGSYETCAFGTSQGDVNSVTLIAEFEPSCEQKTIHEKLDQSLSTLLSAIGMDRDALTYNESPSGARPLLGRPRRQGGDQDWKSVQSFSQRFTISRDKKPSGEYGVTISDQRKVEVPTVNENARQTGLLGGSLRARRLQRQQQAATDAAKQQEEQAAREAERQAQAEAEKAQREAERAEQLQQLLAIQEELKRAREEKAAASEAQVKGTVAKGDFKARLTGIAIIEGGRMCGYEDRANNAEFLSPDTPMEIPYGKAACFRVEYDFPEGYQARVWISDRWQKGEDGSSYYFGSNPSPLYKGKGVAYGFLDMLERGKTCTLKRLAIRTNAEPKLEEPSKEWDIVVTPVDIKFHGPETAQKAQSKEDEKVIPNNQPQGVNSVADKLQSCDFLLHKDFKKNAKFYLCLFSASWCGPCRAEMPRIAKTYAETLKDDPDIELIHFSRDQNDEKALAWAKEHDVKFPVVKPNGGNPLDLHSRGIPHLFIVKADGTLVEEGHPMRLFTEEKLRELKEGNFAVSAKQQNGATGANTATGEHTETVDGYTWAFKVKNDEATIISERGRGCSCAVTPKPSGNLAIPSSLGGAKVTNIGRNAFFDCHELTSVTIPKGVTSIGGSAFSQCSGLTSVTIPSGVMSLGEYSFYYCSRLKSVTIPSSVKSIGSGSFNNCRGLLEFVVEEGNSAYCSIDGVLYNKDRTSLSQYPCAKPGTLTIPASVTSIGHGVLLGCRELLEFVVEEGNPAYCSVDGMLYNKERTKLIQCPGGKDGAVTIPYGVTSIGSSGYWAFRECRRLTSVIIPSSVTSIGSMSFLGCDKLAAVKIPASVERIGNEAFMSCSGLKAIDVEDGNGVYRSIDGILYNKALTNLVQCPGGKTGEVTVPSSVTRIEGCAFYNCRGLTSVTMRGERPDIPRGSFGGSRGVFSASRELTAIHVPANAKSWAGMKEWQGIPLVFDAEAK